MKLLGKNRRPIEPVLVLEEKNGNDSILQNILSDLKIESQIAESAESAFTILEKESFSIFIINNQSSSSEGNKFLTRLNSREPEAVILVIFPEDGRELREQKSTYKLYESIPGSASSHSLVRAILKTLEYKYLKDLELHTVNQENFKLGNQLDWLKYEKTNLDSKAHRLERGSVYSVKTSLSQGSGFGAMTSIIDMIGSYSTPSSNGKVLVDSELLDILYENNTITKNMLNTIANLSDLLEKPIQYNTIEADEFISQFPTFCKDILSFLPDKNIEINYPVTKTNCKIHVDISKMGLVIEELVLNAYKYSENNSDIDISTDSKNGYFTIIIKNTIKYDSYARDMESMNGLISEPFFRIHPPVESVSAIEKFGMGLGITMVESIINKQNGFFFIQNKKDSRDGIDSDFVIVAIYLPIT